MGDAICDWGSRVALGHEYGPAEPPARGPPGPHTSPSVHTASEGGEHRAPPGGQEGSADQEVGWSTTIFNELGPLWKTAPLLG